MVIVLVSVAVTFTPSFVQLISGEEEGFKVKEEHFKRRKILNFGRKMDLLFLERIIFWTHGIRVGTLVG